MPERPHEALLRSRLSGDLARDRADLEALLNCPENADVTFRPFQAAGADCCLVFIEGMSNAALIGELILKAAFQSNVEAESASDAQLERLKQHVLAVSQVETESLFSALISRIVGGMSVLLVSGSTQALCLETRGYEKREVGRTQTESVVVGAQEGFVESLRTNITLVRRYVQSPELISEYMEVGTGVPLRLALMYVKGVVDEGILDELKRRLRCIQTPALLGIGQVQQLIEDHPRALLPQMLQTERPDRTAACLLDGQIAVFAENSPCALIAPVTLFHLLHAPDDSFLRWQYGTLLRVIRAIGIALSLFLPAVYIALTLFHAHLIPMALLASIAETRAKVPFSVVAEVLFMEASFFLINEAGTRIPSQIGSALGIVGALILGQAAVSASVISPILIIVIALTGLGNYAMPNYPFSLGVILCRLALEAAAALLGVYGILLVSLVLLSQLTGMHSLGVPFCAPVAPHRPHNPDLLLRLPLALQRRPMFFARKDSWLRPDGRQEEKTP